MALKPDRRVVVDDISYFMNETGQRGIIVVHNTGGSGAAMDDAGATVKIPSVLNTDVTSGNPAGLLLCDVVNIDLTRQHLNQHKDEVQKGSKVTLLRNGWVVTNMYSGTPTVGAKAYYTLTGKLTPSTGSAQVGRFLGVPDADGYVKVDINIV